MSTSASLIPIHLHFYSSKLLLLVMEYFCIVLLLLKKEVSASIHHCIVRTAMVSACVTEVFVVVSRSCRAASCPWPPRSWWAVTRSWRPCSRSPPRSSTVTSLTGKPGTAPLFHPFGFFINRL